MIRQDSTDIVSLVSYIADTKPFHTKLVDVEVEYQWNEQVGVLIKDKHHIDLDLSSVWEYSFVSNGRRSIYRIPPVVIPRSSKDVHQCRLDAIANEVKYEPVLGYQIPDVDVWMTEHPPIYVDGPEDANGNPPGWRTGAYYIPYNNGIEVIVNGVFYEENIHYTLERGRTILVFNPEYLPQASDNICVNYYQVDRLFVRVTPPGGCPNEYTAKLIRYVGTGNGKILGLSATGATEPETYTVLALNSTQFAVTRTRKTLFVGLDTGGIDTVGFNTIIQLSALAQSSSTSVDPLTVDSTDYTVIAEVGVLFDNGTVSFLIESGSTPFIRGDVFSINVKNDECWIPYKLVGVDANGALTLPKVGTFDTTQWDEEVTADVWEVMPFDTEFNRLAESGKIEQALVYDDPNNPDSYLLLGYIRVLNDPITNGEYWVFEFIAAPPLDYNITLRVEERETYNTWANATFIERLDIADIYSLNDAVDITIYDSTPMAGFSSVGLDTIAQYTDSLFEISMRQFESIYDPARVGTSDEWLNRNSYSGINISDIHPADSLDGIVQGEPEPKDISVTSFLETVFFDQVFSLHDAINVTISDSEYGSIYDPIVLALTMTSPNSIEVDNYQTVAMSTQVKDSFYFIREYGIFGEEFDMRIFDVSLFAETFNIIPANTNSFMQVEPVNVLILYHGRTPAPSSVLTYVDGVLTTPLWVEHINNNTAIRITFLEATAFEVRI